MSPKRTWDLPEIDAQGYLSDPSQWNWEMANRLAQEQRISYLTAKQRIVIQYLRDWLRTHDSWPIPSVIRRDVGVDPRRIFAGPPEVVFKIAGYQNPGSYVRWDEKDLLDRGQISGADSYRMLCEVASAMINPRPIQTTLNAIVRSVAKSMDVKGCSLMLLTPDKEYLRHVASYGMRKRYLKKGRIAVDKSVNQVLSSKSVAIYDVDEDNRAQYREQARAEGIASILSVPIMIGDEAIGVLRIYSAEHARFTNNNIYFAKTAANLGALTLANAVLTDSTEYDYRSFAKNLKLLLEKEWAHSTNESQQVPS